MTQFNLRCVPVEQAKFVTKRDKGICQLCGRDTKQAKKDFTAEWTSNRPEFGIPYSQYGRAERELKEKFGFARGRWYEIDHIKPVVLGGGLTGPENLRLLCGKCHAGETRKLTRKRSEAKS